MRCDKLPPAPPTTTTAVPLYSPSGDEALGQTRLTGSLFVPSHFWWAPRSSPLFVPQGHGKRAVPPPPTPPLSALRRHQSAGQIPPYCWLSLDASAQHPPIRGQQQCSSLARLGELCTSLSLPSVKKDYL